MNNKTEGNAERPSDAPLGLSEPDALYLEFPEDQWPALLGIVGPLLAAYQDADSTDPPGVIRIGAVVSGPDGDVPRVLILRVGFGA